MRASTSLRRAALVALLAPLPLAAQTGSERAATPGVSGIKEFLRVAPPDVKWTRLKPAGATSHSSSASASCAGLVNCWL